MNKIKKYLIFLAFAFVGILAFAFGNNTKVNAADSTVTYTVKSTSEVSVSGTAPTNSTASYTTTYTSKEQLTGGNSMTLTLNGYAGYVIKGITLSMKSNSSKGAGSLSVTAGSTTIASIADSKFNTVNWHGKWSTSYVDVTPTMKDNNYAIKTGENVVITISASANSLYCQSFTFEYETAPVVVPTEVNVNKSTLELNVGVSETLTAEVLPSDTVYTGVSWSSSDETVATVDENGKVTAVAVGTATITAASTYDSTVKGTCEVTVSALAGISDFVALDLKEQLSFHYDYTNQFSAVTTPEEGTEYYLGNGFQTGMFLATGNPSSKGDLTASNNRASANKYTVEKNGEYYLIKTGSYYLFLTSDKKLDAVDVNDATIDDSYLWTINESGFIINKNQSRYIGFVEGKTTQIRNYATTSSTSTYPPATLTPIDGDVTYTDANGNLDRVTMRIGYTISKDLFDELKALGTNVEFGIRLNDKTNVACEAVEVDENNYRIFVAINNIPLENISTVLTAVGYVSVDGNAYYTNEVNEYSVKTLAQEYLSNHMSDATVAAASYALTYLAYIA